MNRNISFNRLHYETLHSYLRPKNINKAFLLGYKLFELETKQS